MQLSAYFDRIGYSGPTTPDFATLDGVMRAHAASVAFENLDVQLGRRSTTLLPGIFAKIVGERRGGWCYEQNGLLGWALGEMGFDVRRVLAGVMREAMGDKVLGNHLTLIVTLDGEPWLVDAGFGGSQAAPIPFAEGDHDHAPFMVGLERADDGYWRFSECFEGGDPFSFDFRDGPADEALFARQCAALQDDPESIFVQNLVVQQRQGDRHVTLRGRVLMERDASGVRKAMVDNAGELVAVLRDSFGLEVPEIAGVWDRVAARHAELFPEEVA